MEPELKFVYLKGVIEGEREHDITLRWSTDDGSLQRLETKTIAVRLHARSYEMYIYLD